MSIHAVVVGNLGADAEIINASGTSILKLRIATSYKSKKEGELTTWVGASIFGARAEALAKLGLSKGDKICVRGELFTREHNGKTYVDLVGDGVDLLGGKKGADAGARTSNGAGRGAVTNEEADDDGIGF